MTARGWNRRAFFTRHRGSKTGWSATGYRSDAAPGARFAPPLTPPDRRPGTPGSEKEFPSNNFDLKWDAWNRLVEVDGGGANPVQVNRYDGLARRITEEIATGDTRHFYYNDQWRSVEEYLNSESTPERRHLWGARSRWDMVLRQRDDAGNLDEERHVLYDAMDPVAITGSNSTVVERFEYRPFGDVTFMSDGFTTGSSSHDWRFLFHGEFLDEATGYYNYGYRYYDPQLGRWPSRDPIRERGGVNLYGMVGNNVANRVDVLGLEAKCTLDERKDCKAEPPVEKRSYTDMGRLAIVLEAGALNMEGIVSAASALEEISNPPKAIGRIISKAISKLGVPTSTTSAARKIAKNKLRELSETAEEIRKGEVKGLYYEVTVDFLVCKCNSKKETYWADDSETVSPFLMEERVKILSAGPEHAMYRNSGPKLFPVNDPATKEELATMEELAEKKVCHPKE